MYSWYYQRMGPWHSTADEARSPFRLRFPASGWRGPAPSSTSTSTPKASPCAGMLLRYLLFIFNAKNIMINLLNLNNFPVRIQGTYRMPQVHRFFKYLPLTSKINIAGFYFSTPTFYLFSTCQKKIIFGLNFKYWYKRHCITFVEKSCMKLYKEMMMKNESHMIHGLMQNVPMSYIGMTRWTGKLLSSSTEGGNLALFFLLFLSFFIPLYHLLLSFHFSCS